ncbi:hypothetical protein GCM10027036_23550 [Flavihumibacter cheonanensis]|uniref:hypothetical protein n=1 Tax=Flavihumibacter cheonanensis TaxID=1442385 RepID=UPI001EF82CC4|nr:hypothetical protein [Flavihumibacter cheonanensis]MCG7754483.1 hypothetical protein [Flavihumibacter cheonanensis]
MRIVNCIILLLFFIGCINYSTEKPCEESNEVYLLIRGPGECVQKISFDSLGFGIAMQGLSKEFYQDSFVSFYEILKKDTFSVDSIKDLLFLKSEIKKYSVSDKDVGGFIYDARRVQLFINGELKVDIYNNNRHEIDELLKIFFKYIEYNINEQCG